MKNFNFIKIISLILSLICVLSLFIACDNGEDPVIQGSGEITINGTNIHEYTVIYGRNNPSAQKLAEELRVAVEEATGESIVVKTDMVKYESGKEILLGHTNRTSENGAAKNFFTATAELSKQEMIMQVEGEFFFLGGATGNNSAIAAAVKNLIGKINATKDGASGALTYTSSEPMAIEGVSYYRIMTYNDGGNVDGNPAWCAELMLDFDPDIVGMQEVQTAHISLYKSKMKSENYKALHHDNTKAGGGYCSPILYKADKFEVLEDGIQWLSDTPDVPYTTFEGNHGIQAYQYAKFKDKETGYEFVVVNVHLSYYGNINDKQVTLLLELTKRFRNETIVYIGDWNMRPSSFGFKTMQEAGFRDSGSAYGKSIPGNHIDFCFVDTNQVLVNLYDYISYHKHSAQGELPSSDHDPVLTEIAVFYNE